MDALLVVLSVVSLVSVVAFAFVVYQLFKCLYQYFGLMFDGSKDAPLLLRLPSRVVSLLFVLCFVFLVL
ncbi:hypothetical protein [Adlercreutzia aquisgranensis]|uniref:hypothetical protein n=1 Tax=Adlercreutzia aquisgranensis TaxID=2941323 RepID=UPI0020403A12|nr:hypothetical protein [Adlercreutzia aquisgranensis]